MYIVQYTLYTVQCKDLNENIASNSCNVCVLADDVGQTAQLHLLQHRSRKWSRNVCV